MSDLDNIGSGLARILSTMEDKIKNLTEERDNYLIMITNYQAFIADRKSVV
jgi:hypothetical protein